MEEPAAHIIQLLCAAGAQILKVATYTTLVTTVAGGLLMAPIRRVLTISTSASPLRLHRTVVSVTTLAPSVALVLYEI